MAHSLKWVVVLASAMSAAIAIAQDDLHLPATVTAGNALSLSSAGSGNGTLYLFGPASAYKHQVDLGTNITVSGEELQSAGRYTIALCGSSCRSGAFFVVGDKVHDLGFLVHPSRVPASQPDAISGTAFAFDKFHNLITAPVSVNFRIALGNSVLMSRPVPAQDGVAWFRTNAGRQAGPLDVSASAENISVRRAVQEVAAEPCRLSIAAQRTAKGILAETAPLRDCAGNPVQDGTIVTFTASGKSGKSTVDAPVKQGIARALIAASDAAVISAASGVVMGNEVRVGAQ
jgi:hypothetical protein